MCIFSAFCLIIGVSLTTSSFEILNWVNAGNIVGNSHCSVISHPLSGTMNLSYNSVCSVFEVSGHLLL